MDLLTVVTHELGHVLGLEDIDSEQQDLMSDTLATGVRRVYSEAGALQPILTLTVEEESNVAEDDEPSLLDETRATQIVRVDVEEPTKNSPALPVEDGNAPTCIDDADSSVEFATSIEIRWYSWTNLNL